MQLYNNKFLKKIDFKLEKDIQTFFESNLSELLNLQLIKSEFSIKDKRIDTLAFDLESQAFVIIEYKKQKNYSVIDQGVSYLQLMLQNKADFILEYNETQNKNLARNTIDWSQSKVIFVSTYFTNNQIQATNFQDFNIELYKASRYEGDIIAIEPIQKTASAPSIKSLDNRNIQNISKEIKQYTEEEHLENKPEEIKELYDTFKDAIQNLSTSITINPKKLVIGFKHNNKTICDIQVQQKAIKLWINSKKGQLDDPKKLTKDVAKIGKWGNGDYEITITSTENLEYIMSLVKQAL